MFTTTKTRNVYHMLMLNKLFNSQMPRHLISDAHEWINEIPTVPTYSPTQFRSSGRRERTCLSAVRCYRCKSEAFLAEIVFKVLILVPCVPGYSLKPF
jgi:hypothetical protein